MDDPLGVHAKLDDLPPSPPESCVYRVHNELRNINMKAYNPVIVAIGPYHHGEHQLNMMEQNKLRYLKLLRERKENDFIQRCWNAITTIREEAEKFYAEPIPKQKQNFVEMMLFDGCFIIELLRKWEMIHLRENNDPIFKIKWITTSLQRDLLLFENQIPFSILCKLFDIIEQPNQRDRLIYLALKFFSDLLPGTGYRAFENSPPQIKHLLGLIHNNWLPSFVGNGEEPGLRGNGWLQGLKQWLLPIDEKVKRNWIPCATSLQEAGVEFKKVKDRCLFDIKFDNGVMKIPPLTIEDRTESFFRNLIAYEQYGADNNLDYITDYVIFMDCLINSQKDVHKLCQSGIIDNLIGDETVVAEMFNKIGDSVTGPGNNFHYALTFYKVNEHCNKLRNQWMANLRRNYFNGPWASLSVIAAILLLLLTSLQTFFTVFPR